MQLSSFVIFLFLFGFCSCHERVLPGTYTSYKASPFEIVSYKLKGLSGYTGGTTLTLTPDSQFVYKTCGHLLNGTWREEKDSILLDVTESYKWIDSTQNIATPLDSVPFYKNGISFEKRNNKLLSIKFNYATKLKRSK